jgi:hypothetical protein
MDVMPQAPKAAHALSTLIATITIVALAIASIPVANIWAAGPWYVSPAGNDGNDCLSATTSCRTIAGALGKASPGDTINIAPGTYDERLNIFKNLTLAGAGANQTIIDGGGAGGVFTIFTARVQMSDLTIRNGRSIGSGGGITNFGTLALVDSSVNENITVPGEGFQGLGGGIANFGTLALTNTAVLSNTGNFGGGIYNRSALTAINSTISGNTAKEDGGGVGNVLLGKANLTFVTVANNTADSDANGTGDGGGLFNATTSTFHLDSSLLGGDTDTGGQAPDCAGTYDSAGHNVIQDAIGCTLDGPDTHAEIIGQDPQIGPLADNGGPTLTHALLPGSPAIDHSDNPSCPPTDQRGVARPQGPACDAGAFEAVPTAPPVEEGVLYVAPDGSDDNDCLSIATACQTIGAALGKASAGNTIRVAAGIYAEHLTITIDITIAGAGAGATIIDGAKGGGVVTIARGNVRIADVTIQNGRGIGAGGGIANFGTLTLSDTSVLSNSAVLGEGFQGFGGGIANFGTLVLSRTSVLSNTAFLGGGIHNSGTLSVTGSMLSENTALFSGGLQTGLGGGITNFGRATLIDSSVLSNIAASGTTGADSFVRWLPGLGGGIANGGTLVLSGTSVISNSASFGGGLVNLGALDAANSTISGNTAKHDGGGIANSRIGHARLSFVTIANNIADSDSDGTGDGGGISNEISGTIELRSTLLAGNTTPDGDAPDCNGTLSSLGHNLVQSLDDCQLAGDQISDIVGQEPQIGPLADNGGPTLTHALLPGSPAIDAGDEATCPAVDQRGVARPQGAACDIGAYEDEAQPAALFAADYRYYIPLLSS